MPWQHVIVRPITTVDVLHTIILKLVKQWIASRELCKKEPKVNSLISVPCCIRNSAQVHWPFTNLSTRSPGRVFGGPVCVTLIPIRIVSVCWHHHHHQLFWVLRGLPLWPWKCDGQSGGEGNYFPTSLSARKASYSALRLMRCPRGIVMLFKWSPSLTAPQGRTDGRLLPVCPRPDTQPQQRSALTL